MKSLINHQSLIYVYCFLIVFNIYFLKYQSEYFKINLSNLGSKKYIILLHMTDYFFNHYKVNEMNEKI